jgi:hypothetical protein
MVVSQWQSGCQTLPLTNCKREVVGECTCGCPTIGLARGDCEQRKTAPSVILADFVGRTPEGMEVGVIAHAREGEISELEFCAIPDWNGPFNLPSVNCLKIMIRLPKAFTVRPFSYSDFPLSVSIFQPIPARSLSLFFL